MDPNPEQRPEGDAPPNVAPARSGSPNNSPSNWMNLEQLGEDNQCQNTNDGQSTDQMTRPSYRRRGRNKMPKERCVVYEVTEVGDPSSPAAALAPFRSSCGVVARDYVPVTYIKWSGKRGDLTVVPDSLKDTLWTRMLQFFQFPPGSEAVVRKRALSIMCTAWKKFKGLLNKEFVQKNRTPDFDEYPLLKDFWDEFVRFKTSEEAQAMSDRNKVNSAKNVYPHSLGPGGYMRKLPQWARREDELVLRGVVPETSEMCPRSRNYLLARGAAVSDDGSLTFRNDRAAEVSRKIVGAHAQSSQGSFHPLREDDELTRALGNKEHGGRTRGVGLVPWKEAFPQDKEMYRKHKRVRRDPETDPKLEARLRDLEEKMAERDRVWREKEIEMERREAEVQRREAECQRHVRDDVALLHSPSGVKSSQASKTTPDEAGSSFPVDHIKEPTPCTLSCKAFNLVVKVGVGQAWPRTDVQLLHNHPIPEGYCKVSLDAVEDPWKGLVLDLPCADEPGLTLEELVHGYLAWQKCYVTLVSRDDEEVNSDDNAKSSPAPQQAPPSPKQGHTSQARAPSRPPSKSTSTAPPRKEGRTSRGRSSDKSSGSHKSTAAAKKLAYDMTDEETDLAVRADVKAHWAKKPPPVKPTVDPQGMDHFLAVGATKQTGRSSETKEAHELSDFERTLRKVARKKETGTKADRTGLMWPFKLGTPLVSPERRKTLSTQLRRLHEWYLTYHTCTANAAFPVKYRDADFHNDDGNFWVELEELYQLYRVDALDVSLIRLSVL
jgi:hypothetical protein